jgi:hypothetical protein
MKVSLKYWRSSIAVVMVGMALIMSMPMAFADSINPGVLDINATLGGKTYGQWSENWWQRAFSLPDNFTNCTENQSGQVWFLDGTTGGPANRFCTVPAGKNIMFPIFNTEQSVVEANAAFQQTNGETTCTIGTTPIRDINGNLITGTDYDALHRCAQAIAEHAASPKASLEAEVDGTTLKNLTHYRAATPPPLFPFTTVAGNPFGLCPGLGQCPLTSSAAADGFWIILDHPLSAGEHTIHLLAHVPFPELNFTFKTVVTYHLTVQAA